MPGQIVYPVPHLRDGRHAQTTSPFGDERTRKDGSIRLHMGIDVLHRRLCRAQRGESCPTDPLDTGRPWARYEGSTLFFVPPNWPIVASQDGEVIRAGIAGRERVDEFVALLHATDLRDGANSTVYVHLEPHSRTVTVGDRVRAGEVLGICGHGPTSVVHLHFDRRRGASRSRKGTQIDPAPYLEGATHIPCPPLVCVDWGAVALAGGLAIGAAVVLS